MKHTVYDYYMVRWLEKHHNNKKISLQNLKRQDVPQLREIFDHLDEDKSGTIEITELSNAMRLLGYDLDQEYILQQFNYVDSDGSGSIDFDEFLTVMTSDAIDQRFFQLGDEIEVKSNDMKFFKFATAYRRKKLLDDLSSGDRDSDVYSAFEGLFSVPNIPNGLLRAHTSNYDHFKKMYETTRQGLLTPQVKRASRRVCERSNIAASKLSETEHSLKSTNRFVGQDRSVKTEIDSSLRARKIARDTVGTASFLWS